MSLVGKIMDFFADKEKTIPAFPRTKVKAVSDDNNVGLNVLLDSKSPIGHTHIASEVGARPNTWMPTAADVGAAPAGFGLGEHIYHHSADGVLEFFDEQLATMPNGTKKFIEFAGDYQTTLGALFVGELCKRDNNYAYVIGYTYSDAMGLYRAKYNGVWNPWEYINPPMVAGEEYRTTERWNGKPVFTQLIDCGLSADKKQISYLNSEQILAVIRHAGRISGSVAPQANNNDWTNAWSLQFLVSTTSAGLRCGSSLVGKQTYLQIWYIKGAEFE